MITWMQRHKKYLVITIWISVIAFVGAGFVGWGAYDMNISRASSLAKVENRKVTMEEFQLTYSNMYNFYNNLFGGKLTKEQAQKMNLEAMVMQTLINDAILLSYADEIGLSATKDEIASKIVNDENFQKDGKFDKKNYIATLSQASIIPQTYESILKKQITLEKLSKVFNALSPLDSEKEIFKSAMLMQDKVKIRILPFEDKIEPKEDEIKKYWEKNKTKYLTQKSYDLHVIEIPLNNSEISEAELKKYYDEYKHRYKDKSGKIQNLEDAKEKITKDFRLKIDKKVALKKYLAFKKGEIKHEKSLNIKINDIDFPTQKLAKAKKGDFLKPIETKNGYVVVKIDKINEPKPQSYENVKDIAANELKDKKQAQAIEKNAKSALAKFATDDSNSTNLGYISRGVLAPIKGLNSTQVSSLNNTVFNSNKNSGYVTFYDKAVVFRITDQKLTISDDEAKEALKGINAQIKNIKSSLANSDIMRILSSRYKIEQYYKGNQNEK